MALKRRNIKNNWSTTLQADAAAAATTLSILQAFLDLLVSPTPSSTDWYMLTLDDGVQAPEIVRCTGKGTGTATVVRSQEGTTAPTTWATGTKVEIRITAEHARLLSGAQVDTTNENIFVGRQSGGVFTFAYQCTFFGDWTAQTLTTGPYNTGFGYSALGAVTTGQGNTAVGSSAAGMGLNSNYNTAMGYAAGGSSGNNSNRNTYLGAYADNDYLVTLNDVICIGYGALAYTDNVASIGSQSSRLSEVYIGGGQRDQTAARVTLSASAGRGTDKAGGDLRLGGGKPTGSGAPGKVIIGVANGGGASGSTETDWTDRAEFDAAGLFWTYGGLKTGDPGLGAGTWKLGTVQAGAVSLDTANYVEVDIGGSVVKLLKAA